MLLSITFLGAVLLAFAAQYFKQDRYKLLEHNVRQAAQVTSDNFRSNHNRYVTVDILVAMRILATAIEADIYLTNTDGEVLLFAEGSKSEYVSMPVPEKVLNAVRDTGEYMEVGYLGGMYEESHYTVGLPVTASDGQVVGMVFASSPADMMMDFLAEILKMFVVSALAVLVLAFAAVYFITAGLVRPLRNMVVAAQSFSKGDFTMRVPVESHDEIGQLAVAFNNMASSLASMEVMRRSFTANVSHELRTPMTTIGGFIDGILDGTIPEEKRDHYLNIVLQEIRRLSRLVRSMLNIARIEAGELEIKPDLFDVNDTVIKTVFTFEQPLEEKRIEVRGLDHDKVMVEADPDLIHQVVYNLIENAVKFANDSGYIEVNYTEDENYTYIAIKNSGAGIARDDIPRVFDRFYKTDKSRSQDKGGAGLGLHIVRSIVNLHGGEIIVRSVEGEYCEFVFTIPLPKSKKVKSAEEKKQITEEKRQLRAERRIGKSGRMWRFGKKTSQAEDEAEQDELDGNS